MYFTVDATPPKVSFLSGEKAYKTSEFTLNFTVNEPITKISYVLDGRENVTITGNTTLTGLSSGEHNLTIYSWDAVGNTGASETISFTVAEPFPTTVIVPVASVAVVGVGLVVYFKKRKHQTEMGGSR
jgi:hypothetical protein